MGHICFYHHLEVYYLFVLSGLVVRLNFSPRYVYLIACNALSTHII